MSGDRGGWAMRLLRVQRAHWRWLLAGAAAAVVTSLSAVGLLAVAGHFIAAMALAGIAGTAIDYFTPAALIRGLAIIRTGGRYAERLATHDATLRGLAQLRGWLFRQLIPLAPARLFHLRSAELFARLRADVDALEHFYLAVLIPFAVALAVALLACVVMLVCLPLAVVPLAAGLLLAGVGLPWWARRRAADDAGQMVVGRARLRGLLVDALRGQGELVAFGADSTHRERIVRLDGDLARRELRLETLRALGGGGVAFLAQATVLGVLPFGVDAIAAGTLSPPELVMIALLILAAFEALASLPEALADWQATRAAAERVFELADQTPAVSEPAVPRPIGDAPGVRFRGVRLRYAHDSPWALDGVDLDLERGARLAIIGPSGGGKSTLIGALLKFYPLQQGCILFGGLPLESISGDELRRRVAVIAQNTALFNLSLLDNLRLANPEASDEAVSHAVASAQLGDFVASLPEGLDTILGEGGARVSGGEARRIVVARALLQDAPVLVMDEPTEGLDAAASTRLYGALAEAARDRTLLLITHRLEGLEALVDEVAVMRDGRLFERESVEVWRRGTPVA